MNLLQIKIDDKLKKAIKTRAKKYGVTASALVRIVLVQSFLEKKETVNPGNIFNADRDTSGRGIDVDDFILALNND